jgi:hypothetical protein
MVVSVPWSYYDQGITTKEADNIGHFQPFQGLFSAAFVSSSPLVFVCARLAADPLYRYYILPLYPFASISQKYNFSVELLGAASQGEPWCRGRDATGCETTLHRSCWFLHSDTVSTLYFCAANSPR